MTRGGWYGGIQRTPRVVPHRQHRPARGRATYAEPGRAVAVRFLHAFGLFTGAYLHRFPRPNATPCHSSPRYTPCTHLTTHSTDKDGGRSSAAFPPPCRAPCVYRTSSPPHVWDNRPHLDVQTPPDSRRAGADHAGGRLRSVVSPSLNTPAALFDAFVVPQAAPARHSPYKRHPPFIPGMPRRATVARTTSSGGGAGASLMGPFARVTFRIHHYNGLATWGPFISLPTARRTRATAYKQR